LKRNSRPKSKHYFCAFSVFEIEASNLANAVPISFWKKGKDSDQRSQRMGKLKSIVYKPKDAEASPTGYTRVPLQEAQLIAGYGIEGDAKGGSRNRQINIMASEALMQLAEEGFQTHPGALGEQLIVEGVDIDALEAGARLRIGDTACIEIDIPRTGCAVFQRHQNKEPKEAAGRIGMMARVIEGGAIRVGDNVQLLESV
jgi:MOSC domain-containing protein YiiM